MKIRTPLLAFPLAATFACRAASTAGSEGSAQSPAKPTFTLDAGTELARKLRAPAGLNLGWVDGDTFLSAVDDGHGGKRLDAIEVVSGDAAPFIDTARMR